MIAGLCKAETKKCLVIYLQTVSFVSDLTQEFTLTLYSIGYF